MHRTANCFIGRHLGTGSISLGAHVISRTVRRRLAERHLGSLRPLRVLPLMHTHRRHHLEWCRARGNWTAAEWNQVVFSDESRFNLSSDDNRVRLWRPRGERLNIVFALQRHTSPTAVVRVRAEIDYNTRSPLVLIRGIMRAQHSATTCACLTRQGCHITISALLFPFFGFPDPQICLHSSIYEINWDGEMGIPRV
ncbi:transposable element Tcb1 transposase [Trichonephila clavipes]|nr:transposable element Tcb1 transposase [Trichonephila clavipes]